MRSSNSHFAQFVAREQRRDQGAYEGEVLFRWMQLLGSRCGIYNVNNAHRCFEAGTTLTHRPAHVVRPFSSVPQFYGCVQCGRSHHCWAERESCEIIYNNELERVEVCRYSGRVIKNQDNLRATYEDTNRRRKSLDNYVAASYCPRGRATSESAPRRPDRATRRRQRLIKNLSVKQQAKEQQKKHRRLPAAQLEGYDLSVESVTESGEESGDDSDQGRLQDDALSSSSQEEEAEEAGGEEGALEGEAKIDDAATLKRKRDDDDEVAAVGHGENSDESYSGDEETGGGGGDGNGGGGGGGGDYEDDGWDQGGGGGASGTGFVKNYHNNLQYNNEQYAFMGAVIRKWKHEKDQSRVFARELQETRAAPTGAQRRAEAPVDEEDRRFALQEPLRNKIYAECELLLHELLTRQSALAHLAVAQQFYAPLLCNIAALVYASEKLSALTRTRTHKNQKQQKNTTQLLKLGLATIDCGRLDSLQSDAEYHEYTLEPRRLCRVLLHYLLVQPLSLRDTMGSRVDVWRRDCWLAHATQLLPAVERDRREMTPSCELVRDCLTSYAHCPYWTRAMIFWPETT
jgi:uncharacterized membrane protein YgcG